MSHNAPYRHFADKDALLAAVAARELERQGANLGQAAQAPEDVRALLQSYVRWALRYPERFHLTFGRWRGHDAGLADAAGSARRALNAAVAAAQALGELPPGDPARLASLVLALAHGAPRTSPRRPLVGTGEGRAEPEALVADLFGCLRAAGGGKPPPPVS